MDTDRWQYAERVIYNATEHFHTDRHHDVAEEWIARAIAQPDRQDYDGSDLYFSYVPEIGKWIRVVVMNHRLHTAYIDRRPMKWWGVPK